MPTRERIIVHIAYWALMVKKGEELDFDKIAQIYKSEKGSKKLLALPPKFYRLYETYLSALKKDAKEAEGENPESPTLMMLKDEIKKSHQRIKQIRELRERKIALLAVLKANGGLKKEVAMTREERALFNDLVKALRSHKDVVVPKQAKKVEVPLPAPQEVEETKSRPETAPEASPEAVAEAVEESQQTIEIAARMARGYKVVQILEDIPTFAGENTSYNLSREEIVSLPTNIAEVLCKRGKATEIKIE